MAPDWDLYDVLGVATATFFGIGAFVYSASLQRRLFTATFLKWVAVACGWALVAPVLYFLTSPAPLSLADAFLLRGFHAGWSHVLIAYATLLGVVTGGAAGLLCRDR